MHKTVHARCLICGSPWEEFETAADGKKYRRCRVCGYLYLSPEFHPDPEEERARYLLHKNSPENSGYVAYLNSIIEEWILPGVSAGSFILDFGSGPHPVFAALLEQRGFNTALYDPFFAPHSSAWHHHYDLITLIEVVEHLSDPVNVLNRLAALLSAGGDLFITTLLYNDKTDFANWWYRMDATHRGFFSETTIHHIAEKLSCMKVQISRGKFIKLTREKELNEG